MATVTKESMEKTLSRLGIEQIDRHNYKRFGVKFSIKSVPNRNHLTPQQKLSHVIRLADESSCRPLVGRFLGDKQIRKIKQGPRSGALSDLYGRR